MKYSICLTCGRMTQADSGFCSFCRSPSPSFLNSPELDQDGIFLGTTNKGQFNLPINFFTYHFSFYGVTGSGKTRLAMKLALTSNQGLSPIIQSPPSSPFAKFYARINFSIAVMSSNLTEKYASERSITKSHKEP